MKHLKTFERIEPNNDYKKGDYVIFDRNLYSFGEETFTKDKPYEIVDILDDINNLIVLINNNQKKVGINDFDDRFKKISKKEAKFLLDQIKYNL